MRLRPPILLAAALWLCASGVIALLCVAHALTTAEQRFTELGVHLGEQVAQTWQRRQALLDGYAAFTRLDAARQPEVERAFVRALLAQGGPGVLGVVHAPSDAPFAPVDPLRATRVEAAVEAAWRVAQPSAAAASPVFALQDGTPVYLLQPSRGGPGDRVALLVRADTLIAQAGLLPPDAGVWLARAPAARPFYTRPARAGSRLARLLLPRLRVERPLGAAAGGLSLRLDWQADFGIVGGFEWLAAASLALALLGVTVLGTRAYGGRRRDRFEREMRQFFQANHDGLTGLANRTLFYDRMQHAIARLPRSGKRLAVLFLDLDRLQAVNDAFGLPAGDRVLQMMAARLSRVLRAEDTVARFGGDEFVVLLEDVSSYQQVERVLERLREELEQPCPLDGGRQLKVGVRIGTAYYPDDGERVEELLTAADRNLYGDRHDPVILL
jgi:diguanylate cyclase (GGDEF)-like protein